MKATRKGVRDFFVTSPDVVANDIVFQGDDATLWQARYDAEPFNGFTFDEIGGQHNPNSDCSPSLAGAIGGRRYSEPCLSQDFRITPILALTCHQPLKVSQGTNL